ncbi:PHD finger protein 10 isoform X2 [Pimephales promelas]|uniref:PHD finger protein 10 isoform X2 n=1 Tax=Pimephales promelas TaxID=90988 RepID=UPI001955B9BA|nr:PHD finger protein 10 isoform X2 [Pimephales promelas]KAG1941665.1 PHD-type domain-containing protein [Pimephales promelas]
MAAVLSPRPCDSNPATPGTQSVKDDIEENSSDGSQALKRRRMGSGDSSRSCDASNQELGLRTCSLMNNYETPMSHQSTVVQENDTSCDADMKMNLNPPTYFPAENLTEYKWPPDDTGEYYMLQEQVSEYLGVTSFKRKYPDLERRDLSHKEKLYLREQNVITETQCTLGLTALRSDEVIDLMIKEYPAKHAEYSVILQERERQRITKEYSVSTLSAQMQQQNPQKVEASKVPEYIKKAAKKAAEFNSNFNRERMEERRAYFDLQTHIIQVPQGKYKVLPPERTKTGPYPVALIPGQFQEYYKRYSPNELRYLPLNTALFEPPLDPELPALDSDGDSDDGEDGKEDGKKHKGSSPKVIPNAICGICQKGKEANKKGKPEALIHCSQCQNSGHPSCLDMSVALVSQIKSYPWQCMECKTCTVCEQPHHEEEMMFCDKCDRGYHTFCVGMDSIPLGCWVCDLCNKEMPTPQKKGTIKTPKKSK